MHLQPCNNKEFKTLVMNHASTYTRQKHKFVCLFVCLFVWFVCLLACLFVCLFVYLYGVSKGISCQKKMPFEILLEPSQNSLTERAFQRHKLSEEMPFGILLERDNMHKWQDKCIPVQ